MIGLNKTLVALFALVLVAGLAGGFILNYVIYQPQIQDLKNDVDKLNNALADNFTNYQTSLDNLTAEVSNLNAIIAKQNSTSQQTSNQSTSNQTGELVERLDFLSISAVNDGGNFTISFALKNTGTAGVAIDFLYLNFTMQPYVTDLSSIVINGVTYPQTDLLALVLRSGDTANGVISLTGGSTFASGDLVDLAFHSVIGNYYDRTVVLP